MVEEWVNEGGNEARTEATLRTETNKALGASE